MGRRTSIAARVLAPLAFLLAVTVFVLLVRAALDDQEPVASTNTLPAETQEAPPAAPDDDTEEPPAPPPPPPPAEGEPPVDATYYEIRSGDTLESIAQQHETTVERLLELNPGIDPVALTVGERIRIS